MKEVKEFWMDIFKTREMILPFVLALISSFLFPISSVDFLKLLEFFMGFFIVSNIGLFQYFKSGNKLLLNAISIAIVFTTLLGAIGIGFIINFLIHLI